MALSDRIEGCLLGAAIGAELGWQRHTRPDLFALDALAEVAAALDRSDVTPEPAKGPGPPPIWTCKQTPIIELGVRAYVRKQGRVTPEDFGRELADDPAIALGAFVWDVLHTTQELLREGMSPRLTGLGTAPHGLLVPAMAAVGIYHYADPEYAYLDGVELASVGQPRLGADWAGLAAAAVAAAFCPGATPETVTETVLKLAHENNKDVYYELNTAARQAGRLRATVSGDLAWWRQNFGGYDTRRQANFAANNPLYWVLPTLAAAGDARTLFALLLWPDGSGLAASHMVNSILAGAVLGALQGQAAFPAEWLDWAVPIARPWFAIEEVVAERARQEARVIRATEEVAAAGPGGRSALQDRIYGCLLASSIGNAMGSSTECLQYWEVDAKHPGGVTTVLEPSRLEGEDDNQMAMLLVETYLRRDGKPVMARHFGETWYDRLDRDHFFPMCMGNSYDLIRAGWDPRVTGHWNQVTGSTVMCMEPVGIYHLADPAYAAVDAEAVSYMYQRGLDVTAAVILAAAVAEALAPGATVDSVCRAALDAAPTTPLRAFDRRAFACGRDYLQTCLDVAARYDDVLAARAELYERCLFYHCIDPLELLGLALAMFRISGGDVRQSAIGGTNIGRDADTIAGRAAMLSGALRGSANVPAEWVALCSPASLARIERNAARLADLLVARKLPVLKRRQEAACPA